MRAAVFALLRSDDADDTTSLLHRSRLDLANRFAKSIDDFLNHAATFINVRNFAAAKYNRDLDFVAVTEKVLGLLHFKVDIVLASLWTQTNFLRLCLMGLAGRLLLALLVLELAVIHDTTNWWLFIWGDFDEVES